MTQPTHLTHAWLRLHLTKGLGRVGIIRLIDCFGDVETALQQSAEQWARHAGVRGRGIGRPPGADDPQLINALESLHSHNAQLLTLWDDNYPSALRQIPDPPAILYIRGTLPTGDYLAIVGSRRATPDGLRLAAEIANTLAQHNITIVSGLARGIDSSAHRGALDGGGKTIAVLGGGIDRVYPPENCHMFEMIAEQGALISEYPPGTPPLPGHFPGRNRIISGLSRGVLIVEAAAKSGSLITADFALDQGRDVFAAPGSPFNNVSQGCHQLIKQGATLITEAGDILDSFQINAHSQQPVSRTTIDLSELSTAQKTLYEKLHNTPQHLDKLAGESGLTPMEVSAIVLHLELLGLAQALPGGRYIRGLAGGTTA
ncbi:MAG: DNA-processing protein DprA [Desulfuromonas sp.]|nr:DNA-processing protein DprA [Desulfuromonas sp.]